MDKNFLGNIINQFKNNKMLMVLAVAGIALLLVSRVIGSANDPQESKPTSTPSNVESFENEIQRELQKMLNLMGGVGKVDVMVTLESGPETIYSENITESKRQNDEQDNQGGTRTTVEYNRTGQLVIVRRGGNEEPVVIKEIMPKVRGVLVVCDNASSPKLRLEITKAIQAVLDVPAYKISIVERQ